MTYHLLVGILFGLSPAVADTLAGGPNWAGSVGVSIVSSILFGLRFAL